MSTLRHRVKKPGVWIAVAAIVIATAAVLDWTRPPERQFSVWLHERAVAIPYRVLARPALSRVVRCRFRPTCSQYSIEAVRRHGFPKGAWRSLKRLARCWPWVSPGTSDPV